MRNNIYIDTERIKRLATFYLPNTEEERLFNEGFDKGISDAVALLKGNNQVMEEFKSRERPFPICEKLFQIERQIKVEPNRMGYRQSKSVVDSMACSVTRKSDVDDMVGFMDRYLVARKIKAG